jgi:hypothetical protein
MTLMEVVIAIGVVAFIVPIFLVMSNTAGDARLNAEADTRSAWLAREVHREILAAWSQPARDSVFGAEMNFPGFADETTPEILAYDSDGNFLTKGGATDFNGRSNIPNASFLVAVYGEAHTPPNAAPAGENLSLIHIRVLHPAKAPPENRREYHYQVISSRPGIP